ncbi:PRC-barrel domain-containing protein [Polymorphobacter sp.]|uniref:PRC-barrel domain-containing protein n=1 Tax=Polymorphobacter sp. TaxID=1909290 RepID=UPI003F6F1C07
MAYDDQNDPAFGGTHETGNLISADKVEGTAVYNAAGDKLGTVDSIMIDKVRGDVPFVVMSFGGFLGIGEKYHPLPWELLEYDTRLDGYRVDLDPSQLSEGPAYDRAELAGFDEVLGGDVDSYYGSGRRSAYGSDTADIDEPNRSDRNDGQGRPLGYYSSEAQAKRNADIPPDADDHRLSQNHDKPGFYSPEQQINRSKGIVSDGDHEMTQDGLGNPRSRE